MSIKYKKLLLLIVCLGVINTVFSAKNKWFDKEAGYCLEFSLPEKTKPGFWQINNYAFPFDLGQGFSVFDGKGKKYRFNLDLRSKILTLAAAPENNTKVYLYPNPKVLEKVAKNRRYYIEKRCFRDWNWRVDQGPSQAVNVFVLSYEPKPEHLKPKPKKAPVKKKVVTKNVPVKKKATPPKVNKNKNLKAAKKRNVKRKAKPKRLPIVDHLPAENFPADNADLKKVFKYKIEQYRYRRNYPQTKFKRAMWWRLKGRFAVLVKSKLKLPSAGKYQFAVKTNDLTQVYLGNKRIISVNKKDGSLDKWSESPVMELSGNMVELDAFYRGDMENTDLTIGWRIEGETDYKMFTQKDFMDANMVEPLSLFSNKGQRFPVIKFEKRGYFQDSNKRQFIFGLETNFTTGSDNDQIVWLVNGRNIDSGRKVALAFDDMIPENIACVVNDSKPFKVFIPVDMKDTGELLHRDLYVKINAPVFIYDDETLDMSVEFHSELPVDIRARLGFSSNNDLFKSYEKLRLFRKTLTEEMFPTHDFVKENFKLEGRKIKDGTELVFDIEGSSDNLSSNEEAFSFDSKKITFKKLAECKELKTVNGYFTDSQGNRVIPILHRPTLEEKRTWSLLNTLPLLLGEDSLTVIADNFGEDVKLSDKLYEKAVIDDIKLVFEDWKLKSPDADLMAAVAEKIEFIRNSETKVLLIIPSSYPLLRGVAPRLQQRLLAALIQTAHANKKIKKIILATPFPLAEAYAGNTTMKVMIGNIQRLVEEQEIDFTVLPKISSAKKESQVITTHPVKEIDFYAEIIINM